jgi:hypothetical protein
MVQGSGLGRQGLGISVRIIWVASGSSSRGERLLAGEKAAGSSPAPRSTRLRRILFRR